MKVQLIRSPEGSPNFCFGLYKKQRGREKDLYYECIEFIQSDWEWAGLASRLGWVACECGRTDGTVKCEHKTVSEMLSSAFDFLCKNDGAKFKIEETNEDYFKF